MITQIETGLRIDDLDKKISNNKIDKINECLDNIEINVNNDSNLKNKTKNIPHDEIINITIPHAPSSQRLTKTKKYY